MTGIGVVTPLGVDLAATRRALAAGDRAVRGSGFDPRPHLTQPKALKLMDRRTQMAVAAASMALADASLPSGSLDGERLGVLIGSSGSDLQAEDLSRAVADPGHRAAEDIAYFSERILSGLNPLWLLVNLPNMVSAHVAIQLDARGPNSTVMTDWIAGAQAIGEAAEWIRAGEADAVLAGGADVGVLPFVFAGYDQAGLFTDGGGGPARFALSEGAAVLLLEESGRAAKRRARVYGEVSSYACASTPGGRDALVSTMTAVLEETRRAGLPVVSLCCASVFQDSLLRAEQDAVAQVFGPTGVEIVEFRSALGHALSAAPAIDAALMLCALGESAGGGAVLCNSLGFLGQSATLAFSRNAA